MSDRAGSARGRLAETALAWAATALSCGYLYWAYTVLARYSTAFKSAYGAFGDEIPASPRLLLEHQGWLYPAIFGSTALLLLAKELLLRDKRLTLALTFAIALMTLFVVDSLKTVLLLPLLDTLENLS